MSQGSNLADFNDPNINTYTETANNGASGTFTVTEEKKAVKIAIVVGEYTTPGEGEYLDDEYGEYVMKCFSAVYTIDENAGEITLPKADPPTFSIADGSQVEAGTTVELLPRGDKIFFALGSKDTKPVSYTEYNRINTPIKITSDTTVWAYRTADGHTESDTVKASYTVIAPVPVKPAAPVFSPAAGEVSAGTKVRILAEEADNILVAVGQTESSALNFEMQNSGYEITVDEALTIKAFSVKAGVSSDTVKASYTIRSVQPSDPDKATILLVVDGTNSPYLDRHQYQILLDAAHQISDTYKIDLEQPYLDASILPRLYAAADATLPAGIGADNLAVGVNPDEQASVTVEPGLYDILLLQSYNASWMDKDILRSVYDGEGADDGPFYIDNLTLAAGGTYLFKVFFDKAGAHAILSANTDLQLTDVLGENKPSCELDSLALSLSIDNIGLENVTGYDVYYTTGNNDTVKERVDETLAAGSATVYTFRQKIALRNGEKTLIKAGILLPDDNTLLNNTGEYTAFFSGASPLPVQMETDKMQSAKTNDWTLDQNKALVASKEASTPVFSSCFHVESAGTYRLTYENICGKFVQTPSGTILFNNVDIYRIHVGKTSGNWTEWPVILTDSTIAGVSTTDEFDPKEVSFDIAEPGDYAFCIYADRVNDRNNLKFRNMAVEKVEDFSVRLNNLTVHSPRIVPQDWGNASYKTTVNIENRGLEKLDNATLSISVNGTETYQSTVSLGIDTSTDLTFETPVSGFKKDDIIRITGEVLLDAKSIGKGVAEPAEITVSENTAAFDYMTDFSDIKTLQSYTGGLVGIIFPVVKTDTLTGISCGWGAMEENTDISIAIHKVTVSQDEISMGQTVYENVVRRGVSSGLTTYNIPAFLLEPGNYFISVEQIDRISFALAMDEHPDGGFHVYDKTEKNWKYLTQAGYPVIRAVFGSNGSLKQKDASITAISKPIAGGIFANNEPIVVSVRNNGTETVEIPVYVRVDNTLLDSKSVTLEPYASSDLTFSADLAATEQNRNIIITAFTTLDGDEDLSNDTLTKKVISMVPADPYRMDFESCLDFATEGLNPAWTSVSLDKTPVAPLRHVLEHEFHYVEFPGSETDLGFIAFNPLNTEPSMVLYEYYEHCRSHSGQRFGVALGNNDYSPKDDWLISPKLKMPAKNTQLSMWVKSFDRVFKETYEIWVSEGSNDPTSEDFVLLYPAEDEDEELIAPTEWTQVVFDLGRYNAKEIHVAIRCNTADAPMFMIDDIVIGENAGNEEDQQADFRLTVYPNPAKEMVMVLSPDAAITSVAIFNLSGHMVHQASRLNTENYRFNASSLTSGMYFVRVTTDRGIAIRKFVIR